MKIQKQRPTASKDKKQQMNKMGKRIFTAWGLNGDNRPNTLVEGDSPALLGDGTFDKECEKLFWTIEACSSEEAKAIYYLRQGWQLNFIDGTASDCPQCGETIYQSESGECWNCGFIGEYIAHKKLPSNPLQKLQSIIDIGGDSPIKSFKANLSSKQVWKINIVLRNEINENDENGLIDEIELSENTATTWFKCRINNSKIEGEGGSSSFENMIRAVCDWLENKNIIQGGEH